MFPVRSFKRCLHKTKIKGVKHEIPSRALLLKSKDQETFRANLLPAGSCSNVLYAIHDKEKLASNPIMSPATCHVIVLPYPGRGHVNPMMNLCKLLSSRCPLLAITFVVTEEWLGLIGSEQKPENVCFATIPNVLPSERVRGSNVNEFIEAILTKMEDPFEKVLDRLTMPLSIILADVFVSWVVDVGNRRNVPVALLWPMPISVFSIFYHFDLLVKNGHFPADLAEIGDELIDYIPGLAPIKISDLPPVLHNNETQVQKLLTLIFNVSKAKYLLFTSIFELESPVFEALKPKFPFPLYSLGPLIPYSKLQEKTLKNNSEYFKWLDSQPQGSVLYVSLGSFLPVSSSQMDEIISGLCDSGVTFLLVVRDKTLALEKYALGKNGMIVNWCDQLRVLCHVSIGGFWTHCGWNSTMESVFAAVPMIGFPITMDQLPISKIVAEDWKIGWKVKRVESGKERLVRKEEICELVRRFMDRDNEKKKEMIERAIHFREICRGAIQKGGSSELNLGSFVRDILK